MIQWIDGGGWTSVPGTSVGVTCGSVKRPGLTADDVVVLAASGMTGAVITRSTAASAPCLWTRANVPGRCHAVVINAGNANASTGEQGVADTRAMAQAAAGKLGCTAQEVLVCSTGVIGVPLPMDRVIPAVERAAGDLAADGNRAARAILTTDLMVKECALKVAGYTVGGFAKGSGMIHPDMGTMLGFVVTDAPISGVMLQKVTESLAERTFNCVTVDGDISTSDTLIIQALGEGPPLQPGMEAWDALEEGLFQVCRYLARAIARDGEGAETLITVEVNGTESDDHARQAARAVARSPLVKTAIHGRDANWGRVVGALGAARVEGLETLELTFAGFTVLRQGQPVPVDDDAVSTAMAADEVVITATLPGTGRGEAWGCDLTDGYIRINADYRS